MEQQPTPTLNEALLFLAHAPQLAYELKGWATLEAMPFKFRNRLTAGALDVDQSPRRLRQGTAAPEKGLAQEGPQIHKRSRAAAIRIGLDRVMLVWWSLRCSRAN